MRSSDGSTSNAAAPTWTLPLPAVLPLAPLLMAQGRRVRRGAVVLPEAAGVRGAVGADGDGTPWRLCVVGDSVAAGVGVADHTDTLAGALARKVHAETGRTVRWSVRAVGGLTAGGISALLELHAEEVAASDLVVLSVGVNDAKDLHTTRRWRAELGSLLDTLGSHRPVVLLGIPPMQEFPALPRPLADVLGARGRRLDRVGAQVAAARPWVTRVAYDAADLGDVSAFAPDGFHPGPEIHAAIAARILAEPSLVR